jgi:hypothetical protein
MPVVVAVGTGPKKGEDQLSSHYILQVQRQKTTRTQTRRHWA